MFYFFGPENHTEAPRKSDGLRDVRFSVAQIVGEPHVAVRQVNGNEIALPRTGLAAVQQQTSAGSRAEPYF